jgi:predicted kinase
MNKPKMIMMCGLPASTKSTKAKELAEEYNATIYSSDEIRKELLGDENSQDNNNLVFSTLHSRIKSTLSNGHHCIYDACNISYKRRMAFLNELNKIPCEKICVFMATPYEECLKNNSKRERKVPNYVIERMYRHFDPPYYYEGWDNIEVVYAENSINYYGTSYDFLKLHRNYNQSNSHHKLSLGEHCDKAWYYVTENQQDCESHNFGLRVATILHDCGKPFCRTFKNSKGEITEQAHYYDHQYTGSYDSFFWVSEYCNPLYIAVLIRWHMQLYFIAGEKTLNKYRKLWGEELYRDIALLHEADVYAH